MLNEKSLEETNEVDDGEENEADKVKERKNDNDSDRIKK